MLSTVLIISKIFCDAFISKSKLVVVIFLLKKQSQTPHRDVDASTTRVAAPQVIRTVIKMHYFGPSLKLDTSIDLNSRGDLVLVEQQPSGSGTLIVFRDYVKRGSEFNV